MLPEAESAEAAFEEIAARLTGRFSALPAADLNRSLAFVGAGWTAGSFAQREPQLVRISNIHDIWGTQQPVPADQFSVEYRVLGSEPLLVDVAGIGLSPDRKEALETAIASGLGESQDGKHAARAVVRAIREEAEDRKEIGRGVMLNNLPRAPGPPDGLINIMGSLPNRDVRTFAYFPEGDEEAVMLGPLIVGSDGNALGEATATGHQLPSLDDAVSEPPFFGGIAYLDPLGEGHLPEGAIGQSVRRIPKFQRNDPCWCESGKKFKKCHGR